MPEATTATPGPSDPEDFRFDYSRFKDSGPTSADLSTIKAMLVKSSSGAMWSRILTLVTVVAFAVFMWLLMRKIELQQLIERQEYLLKRSDKNKDRVDDPMSGRPKP